MGGHLGHLVLLSSWPHSHTKSPSLSYLDDEKQVNAEYKCTQLTLESECEQM